MNSFVAVFNNACSVFEGNALSISFGIPLPTKERISSRLRKGYSCFAKM